MRLPLLLTLLLLPRTGAALDRGDERVIVISLDSMKRASRHSVPAVLYQQTLVSGISAVSEAVTPALERREAARETNGAWTLNSIGVALGLSAQFGLGPLLNVTVTPQLKLVFSDSRNPVFPD